MNSLDEHLSQLPRELPLERDLWPAIDAAITADAAVRQRPRSLPRRIPLALAAGLAIALTAGIIGWQAGRSNSLLAAAEPGTAGFAVPADPEYVKTRASLEHTYQDRLALLEPVTRERIEHDLSIIRAANADIRRALAADPQSAVLNRLLASTWQQEFDLYATVVRTTEPAMQRNRT
jgi:hypothetical protein